MQVKQVQKKTVETEAVQFLGGVDNAKAILTWVLEKQPDAYQPGYLYDYTQQSGETEFTTLERIKLGHGWSAKPTDWIIWDEEANWNVLDNETFQERYQDAEVEE